MENTGLEMERRQTKRRSGDATYSQSYVLKKCITIAIRKLSYTMYVYLFVQPWILKAYIIRKIVRCMLKQDRRRWYRINLRQFCVTMQTRSYNTIASVIFESTREQRHDLCRTAYNFTTLHDTHEFFTIRLSIDAACQNPLVPVNFAKSLFSPAEDSPTSECRLVLCEDTRDSAF